MNDRQARSAATHPGAATAAVMRWYLPILWRRRHDSAEVRRKIQVTVAIIRDAERASRV